jgi:hypothetical protein
LPFHRKPLLLTLDVLPDGARCGNQP